MKAILIDPKARTIEPIDVADTLEAIYAALGCKWIEEMRLDARNVLYVDEEGLQAERCDFFTIGTSGPLCNRALVAGFNRAGDSVDTTLDLETVRRAVRFLAPAEALEHAQRYDSATAIRAANAREEGAGFIHVVQATPLIRAAIERGATADVPAKPH